MWTDWAKATTNRAVRTAAQTAAALIGASTVLAEINWTVTGSTVAVASLLSVLTSVATDLPEV